MKRNKTKIVLEVGTDVGTEWGGLHAVVETGRKEGNIHEAKTGIYGELKWKVRVVTWKGGWREKERGEGGGKGVCGPILRLRLRIELETH